MLFQVKSNNAMNTTNIIDGVNTHIYTQYVHTLYLGVCISCMMISLQILMNQVHSSMAHRLVAQTLYQSSSVPECIQPGSKLIFQYMHHTICFPLDTEAAYIKEWYFG